MNREFAFRNAPRCTATSKRTHERCQAPAVRGWTVCRFHGARGGGPMGSRNGRYRHGSTPRKRSKSIVACWSSCGPPKMVLPGRGEGAGRLPLLEAKRKSYALGLTVPPTLLIAADEIIE
jgi:hypothetical protein